MPVDKKKRSRSPSELRPRSKKSHHKNKDDKTFDKLQDQVSNLTKVVEVLLKSKKRKNFNTTTEDNEENNKNLNNIQRTEENTEQSSESQSRDIVLKALGVDLSESKFKEKGKITCRSS
ncbi:hypothetical protein KPH14_008340 [Odynerus spinipes]|uniref:Uncharacterized protein n=1 Tax=Odynerus spinipes TaxID=1348599 RepID=A0AAD9RE90_9HYME|nr:hypothetical protein KPH14_008340 [Odynerus spinipes]